MPLTPEGRARMAAACAASNRRRGEQDPQRRLAKRKFCQHKSNAEHRGVQFLLTFDEWWNIWAASGKWEQRGMHDGQYCMSRYGDRGAYEVGNVFINLFAQNTSEGVTGIKRTPKQNAARSVFMRGNQNFGSRRWVSKDGISRSVRATEVPRYIESGWYPGRIDMCGRDNQVTNEK